ncbi:sensor domain-containing protein, partial [Halobacterium bonnevillei]
MPSPGDVARSTLYLLVSFPLGVVYLALVVSGVIVGVPLLLFAVGVVVLAGVAAVARRVAVLDAGLGARLFDVPAPVLAEPRASTGVFDAAFAELAALSGYRAVAYLLVRFGIGVVGFTFVVTWLGAAAALVATPLYYDDPAITVGVVGVWEVETLAAAVAVAGV